MLTRLFLVATFAAALLMGQVGIAASPVPAQDSHSVNFDDADAVIELKDSLGPYHLSNAARQAGSAWYMLTVANAGNRAVSRVLQAGQPASAALQVLPRSSRPAIIGLASSDPGVTVERATAYGHHAWRVTLPPATTGALAIEVANAQSPPSLFAWTEPALAAHNRQLAIFIAAVAGLIFAAAAIAIGLAVITGHKPPLWTAAALTLVLLTRLAGTGMFDASLATRVGGPYGLAALFAGLALVAGARLADTVVPLRSAWPWAVTWFDRGCIALVALSVLAYLGVPGTALLTEICVVLGTAGITVYLVHRGRYGAKAARVVAPSAAVFALVTLAAAIATLGGFGGPVVMPDIAGGFAAAGAVLLVLAVAAGEGIAVLPLPRRSGSTSAATELPIALEAIGASHQGIFDLDFALDEVHMSREAGLLLGLDEASGRMRHADWIGRVHPDDRAIYQQALADYRVQAGLAFRIEFRARTQSGRHHWFELRATMMGAEGSAGRCLGLIADTTLRKEGEAAAADHDLRDPLTGLGNRAALLDALGNLGDGFLDTTLAQLDIDRFKSIHASLGDEGGDTLLTQISGRLTKRLGKSADLYRVGGDAFAVLSRQPGAASSIGARLVEMCAQAYSQDGRSIFAPASVGVTVGQDARDAHDLIKNAEIALAQAKRDGGGCARLYASAMSETAKTDSVALEADLRSALDKEELDVFYQPIVRLADGAVAGFEALLRWRHPEKGLIAPADFIAHSEETGLIVMLGRFALERAAHDLSQWQRFFPLTPPLFVSVNVSRRQLRDQAFEAFLRQLLEICGVAPGTLKLEVTESAIASNAHAALRRIRALGAGLAIDDFGTGQSSLSQLKDIPFDTVKIDKSFLARHGGTHNESEGEVVLGSIVALAHGLKRDVVVEGVETAEDVARLKDIGCEYAQGFYFAPPMSMLDTLNYIARHYDMGGAASGATGLGG